MNFKIEDLAWEKMNGLIPAIVQDKKSSQVLMLGYMDQNALERTIESGWVTFFSRSRQELWTKGESSGNRLKLAGFSSDCDGDSLLILAEPTGPVCHTGTSACFSDAGTSQWQLISEVEKTIAERESSRASDSYTGMLFNAGLSRIAQKVGEEAVEVVIAAMGTENETLCAETADLFFHLLVLLRAKALSFSAVIGVLEERRFV